MIKGKEHVSDKERLAIIGTGIAGMACGYKLHQDFDITLFEKNTYVGGHTNTVSVQDRDKMLPIDTGFMVYNDVTYPNLIQLFEELEVDSVNTSMSFGVNVTAAQVEFACSGLNGFFAQRKNLFKPYYWRMLQDIIQFFKEANQLIDSGKLEFTADYTVERFFKERHYKYEMVNWFLIPMASAIWSTPAGNIRDYPVRPLFQFMKNHGLLGIGTQHQWKTVAGGSQQYREKLIKPFRSKINLKRGAKSISKGANCVYILDEQSVVESFDKVIIATHADQALALLEKPTVLEKRLLGAFDYNTNPVFLHSDASVMPKSKRAWASWNYRVEPTEAENVVNTSTHYWMNSLQGVSRDKDYFVSVDYDGPIDERKIHWDTVYQHPRYDTKAITAQEELHLLNQSGTFYFCGSYFRHGFHEDALSSALNVCDLIHNEKKASSELVANA